MLQLPFNSHTKEKEAGLFEQYLKTKHAFVNVLFALC